MKFEKFLKQTGTHGQIFTRDNGTRWLVCGGVGMKVPAGVVNLLGSGEVSEKVKTLVEGLVNADIDDKVKLTNAVLMNADGKACDIIRVFSGEDMAGDYIEVGIINADFGLLEKADYNLAQVEVETKVDYVDAKYLLVLDPDDEVIGFIQGVDM